MQRKEGDWQTFEGRPPIESGEFGQTARAILARCARSLFPPEKTNSSNASMRIPPPGWKRPEPLTTEDRTMQILGLVWAGHTAPAGRVKELVAGKQRTGWRLGARPTINTQSDAFATGERALGAARIRPDVVRSRLPPRSGLHPPSRSKRMAPARCLPLLRIPALLPEWLPRRARPVDFAGGNRRSGGHRAVVCGKIAYSTGPAISCLTLSKK